MEYEKTDKVYIVSLRFKLRMFSYTVCKTLNLHVVDSTTAEFKSPCLLKVNPDSMGR